jgi:hypothetical protein
MSNIFEFRDGLISDYSRFSTSFANIAAPDIKGAEQGVRPLLELG